MSNTSVHRDLVLSRLGAPDPLLPGESYRYRSPRLEQIERRFDRFLDEDERGQPSALTDFIAVLEAERARDHDAFRFGRELLLDHLRVYIALPESDPERSEAAPPAHERRALVLERLGWPHPRLPGEGHIMIGGSELTDIRRFLDTLEPEQVDEAVLARVASLRERDWDAFCFARTQLLLLLPVEIDPPRPVSPEPRVVLRSGA